MIYDPTTNTLYGKPDGNLDQHRQYALAGDRRDSRHGGRPGDGRTRDTQSARNAAGRA